MPTMKTAVQPQKAMKNTGSPALRAAVQKAALKKKAKLTVPGKLTTPKSKLPTRLY